MTFDPASSQAPFLPVTTFFPDDFEQFRIRFLQLYTLLARSVNVRGIAIFDQTEFLCGEQWPTQGNAQSKRSTYRTIYFIGGIAAGATSTTPHGLSTVTSFTNIYGTAITDTPDNRPIPYASATLVTNQIEINVDGTNINIINGATAPNITSAIVVLEYLKN